MNVQAHAALPHNGAGAGQAIEDAYVLGELLKMPECTREALPRFLLAYEAVRRPRASAQQVHSRESGEVRSDYNLRTT
jgi:salicylate hydroxylase